MLHLHFQHPDQTGKPPSVDLAFSADMARQHVNKFIQVSKPRPERGFLGEGVQSKQLLTIKVETKTRRVNFSTNPEEDKIMLPQG